MPKDDDKDTSARRRATAKPVPPKKSAMLLFVLLLVAFVCAIAATLLLANDRRNLRALLDRYVPERLIDDSPRQPAGTHALKGRRLTPVQVAIPARFFATPEAESLGSLVREVRAKGEELCAAFKAAGIDNQGWQSSQAGGKTYECLSETLLPAAQEGAQDASFFFIVKGTADGEVGSIRMKLVAPETADGAVVHRMLVKALEQLIEQARWLDLAPAIESAKALADFTAVRFGISLRFTHEFTAPHSYNLIVMPTSNDASVNRSRAYFATQDWLPLPAVIARVPDYLLPHVVGTKPALSVPPSAL
ncbi:MULTISPECIES: DUF6030 family protein [Alphaproteobacteria]|uniref:Uncharacterized protein n=2 Tax=Alphaproteobacteria TaxID=28211 RepID=A0A512HDQ7_9HYPH|nr:MULTISPECIES: DUF6030 family protein [Alphaproteobacteria]GEO83490.1 hypothetical protein RNA01_04220 [Ciceribacter naphthalenivorans]GLR24359.1 hypothetical protein GCM10007920_41530 [Ciceribacter naphthalenivorans]GLT07215.1 hypothetical protein GCM10007926_41530 [Sphingomonas psychrolutea]